MKFRLAVIALALPLIGTAGAVEAKGCLKGAVVGGLAGHFAGRHGTVGAAAGCAIGSHRARTKAVRSDAQGTATSDAAVVPKHHWYSRR